VLIAVWQAVTVTIEYSHSICDVVILDHFVIYCRWPRHHLAHVYELLFICETSDNAYQICSAGMKPFVSFIGEHGNAVVLCVRACVRACVRVYLCVKSNL